MVNFVGFLTASKMIVAVLGMLHQMSEPLERACSLLRQAFPGFSASSVRKEDAVR